MNNRPPPGARQPAFIEAQYAFAAHIRDPLQAPPPAGVEDRRMAIYRELFFNNVEGFLASTFPVLRSIMNDDAWLAMARHFYAHHQCHSPLFLEIPREFLHYLEQEREPNREDPAFLTELAHYEWVELALSVAESSADEMVADPGADLLHSLLQASSLAWALNYRFPVHRIRPGFQPQEPSPETIHMLVYRDREDEVGFLELNPVSARLFSLISSESLTGLQAMERIAAELQHPNPQAVLAGGLEILEQWRQRGIVMAILAAQ